MGAELQGYSRVAPFSFLLASTGFPPRFCITFIELVWAQLNRFEQRGKG